MINIKNIFSEIVTGNRYDLKAVSEHIQMLINSNQNASQLPKSEYDFVEKHHVGGSLQYAMALFFKLRRYSIESYIAISRVENPETHKKTGTYVSVMYVLNDKRFFADPGRAVKTGTCNFYEIPPKDFIKKHGTVWLYDPYGEWGEYLFFDNFFALPIQVLEKE